MAAVIKKTIGDGGGGADQSHGTDRIYEVLINLANAQNALIATVNILRTEINDVVAQFNTLKTEYDAETVASHTDSAATDLVATASSAVAALVTIES